MRKVPKSELLPTVTPELLWTRCHQTNSTVANKVTTLWWLRGLRHRFCNSTSADPSPMHYSIWHALQQLVYRQKFKNIDHLKQVLNSCWMTISQELINDATGQSFIHTLDTLNIVSVNPVICACCKLFLLWTALKISSVFDVFCSSLTRC